MKTTVYLAWHGLFPYKRLGSPFFWIGTMGVGLGVMLLIIVLSVMAGFGETYRQKIVQLGGDFRVEGVGPIMEPDAVMKKLEKSPLVQAASPYGQGFMMIEHARRPAFPIVRGIDVKKESKVIPLASMMKDGDLAKLNDDGVVLSTLLARKIGATVGQSIDIYTPLMISKLTRDEVMLPKSLKIVGVFETGWHDFDENSMLITLGTFQDLYGLGDSIHGVTLRLKDPQTLAAAKTELQQLLGADLKVSSWKDLFKDFLWVLDLEKNMMFFLMMFVILVAAFAMGAAQLMTVLRKTREIGLLMAMGATTGAVATIYAIQGAVVGVTGVVLGNAIALGILAFRNDILHAIANWTGTYETLVQFYQFYDLPMSYNWTDATGIAIAAVLLATLSGLIPAALVARLKPSEALRND